jgi:anti-sigma regulatory factor (Ser/Thr protein kinase)
MAAVASVFAEPDEVSLDIQTVVSELATNAIRAQCRRLSLALDAHHSYMRIATSDDAPGEPIKQKLDPNVPHGRGLLIVDALSTRWGVTRENGTKTVWADIALPANLGPTFDCTD